jgi:hypothetical protein
MRRGLPPEGEAYWHSIGARWKKNEATEQWITNTSRRFLNGLMANYLDAPLARRGGETIM